ncbi:MAG: hypothetical protein CMH65_02300 [Nevskiales bacterium]|nr:hypothetical protein [Nevskiales bacterium]
MLKQHRELVARKGGSNKPHGNKHRPQRAGTATDVVKDDTTAGQGIIASIKLTNSVYPATAGLISHKVLWRLLTGSDDKTAVPTQEQFLHARTVSQYNCTCRTRVFSTHTILSITIRNNICLRKSFRTLRF